jgi:cytochrome c
MDGFEINKIVGAVLGACLFTLALNIVAGGLFAPHKPAKPGYEIAVTETPGAGSAQAAVAPDEPIEKLLASADVNKGASAAKKCLACHDFAKGGPNKVGPNLWGIVGRDRASHGGFAYSTPMKSKGGKWTFEELNNYLKNPRAMVPGTSMAFIGLTKPSERADVIAYLNSLSDSPQPLPKPQAQSPPPPAAPPADAPASPAPAKQ